MTDAEIWIENYTMQGKIDPDMAAGSVLISEMTFINRPLKQHNFLELLDSTLNKIRPDREIIILRDFNTCMKNENHYYIKIILISSICSL